MSFLDMIAMSAANLWRRKLRTALTVLGVLIGTASIVAMLSLALGMKQQLMAEFSSYGSTTQITVQGEMGNDVSEDMMLSDTNIQMFEDMEHVVTATGNLDIDSDIQIGKYGSWLPIKGVDKSVLEGLTLSQGELPSAENAKNKIPVVVGNTVLANFYDMTTDDYSGYYESGELPNIDVTKDLRRVRTYADSEEENTDTKSTDEDMSTEETEDSISEVSDTEMESAADMSQTDSYIYYPLEVTGVMEGSVDDYSTYSDSLLTDVEVLKDYLMKTYGKGKIPGQPKKNGKPMKEWIYSSAVLEIDDSANVTDVQQEIQEMGFNANSNQEMLESIQSTMKIVELVLGGIGMVAFIVAAIGIANTMMMSTYERTKEIGVMKVLGCDMKDIRGLFLAEAAFIGFIGGLIGLGFSAIISSVVNSIAISSGEVSGNISMIPWWLALAAVSFSTLMGMLAGYFPARRAMRLSPLAAIRTE